MKCRPLVFGGYASLVLAGWAAGRWVWPTAAGLSQASGGNTIHEGTPVHPPGPAPDVVQKTPPLNAVDGTAAGLELKAADSDADFRDRARQMALEPPPALTDFLASVTDSETVRKALLEDAVVWAYCRNPEKGLALLASLKDRADIATLTAKAMRFFPPKDLPVVMEWFQQQPEGNLKSAARGQIIKVLAVRDFRRAVALATAMPQKNEVEVSKRMEALRQVSQLALHKDQKAALTDSTMGLSPGDIAFFRMQLLQQEVSSLRYYRPEAVVEKLSGPDDALPGLITADFFYGWAESDPIRAAQGLDKVPIEKKTPPLYQKFAAAWTKGNVGMASQWVKDLPAGDLKQGAVRGLVDGLRENYPTEAVIWAGSLTDPTARVAELKRLLDSSSGPAAVTVKAAANGLNLTPGERAELNLPTAP